MRLIVTLFCCFSIAFALTYDEVLFTSSVADLTSLLSLHSSNSPVIVSTPCGLCFGQPQNSLHSFHSVFASSLGSFLCCSDYNLTSYHSLSTGLVSFYSAATDLKSILFNLTQLLHEFHSSNNYFNDLVPTPEQSIFFDFKIDRFLIELKKLRQNFRNVYVKILKSSSFLKYSSCVDLNSFSCFDLPTQSNLIDSHNQLSVLSLKILDELFNLFSKNLENSVELFELKSIANSFLSHLNSSDDVCTRVMAQNLINLIGNFDTSFWTATENSLVYRSSLLSESIIFDCSGFNQSDLYFSINNFDPSIILLNESINLSFIPTNSSSFEIYLSPNYQMTNNLLQLSTGHITPRQQLMTSSLSFSSSVQHVSFSSSSSSLFSASNCSALYCDSMSFCDGDGNLSPVPLGYYSPAGDCNLFRCTNNPHQSNLIGPSFSGKNDCPFVCTQRNFVRKFNSCVKLSPGFFSEQFSDEIFTCPLHSNPRISYDDYCNLRCDDVDFELFNQLDCVLVPIGFFSPKYSNQRFKCTSPSVAMIPISRGRGHDDCEFVVDGAITFTINLSSFRFDVEFDSFPIVSTTFFTINDITFELLLDSQRLLISARRGEILISNFELSSDLVSGPIIFSFKVNNNELSVFYQHFEIFNGNFESTFLLKILPRQEFGFVPIKNFDLRDAFTPTFSINYNPVSVSYPSCELFYTSPFDRMTCHSELMPSQFELLSDSNIIVPGLIGKITSSFVDLNHFLLIDYQDSTFELVNVTPIIDSQIDLFSATRHLVQNITVNISFLSFNSNTLILPKFLGNFSLFSQLPAPLFTVTPRFGGLFSVTCTAKFLCKIFTPVSNNCPLLPPENSIIISSNSLIISSSFICFYHDSADFWYLPSTPISVVTLPLLEQTIKIDLSESHAISVGHETFAPIFGKIHLDYNVSYTLQSNSSSSWHDVAVATRVITSSVPVSFKQCFRLAHDNYSPSVPFCFVFNFFKPTLGVVRVSKISSQNSNNAVLTLSPKIESSISLYLAPLNFELSSFFSLSFDSLPVPELCNTNNFVILPTIPSLCIVSRSFTVEKEQEFLLIARRIDYFPSIILDSRDLNYDYSPSLFTLFVTFGVVFFSILFVLMSIKLVLLHFKIRNSRLIFAHDLRKISFYSENFGQCSNCQSYSDLLTSKGCLLDNQILPAFSATLQQSAPNLDGLGKSFVEIIKTQEKSPMLCEACFKEFYSNKIQSKLSGQSFMIGNNNLPTSSNSSKLKVKCDRHFQLFSVQVEASIKCFDCEREFDWTNLCELCSNYLHQQSKYSNHEYSQNLDLKFENILYKTPPKSRESPRNSSRLPKTFVPESEYLLKSLSKSSLIPKRLINRTRVLLNQSDFSNSIKYKSSPSLRLRTPQSVAIQMIDDVNFDTINFD
ncbi:hypothetical protein RCL1_002331 [Eukaryota sp. TZLM3-RCL]